MNFLVALFISSLFPGVALASPIEIKREGEVVHMCDVTGIEVQARYDNQPCQIVLELKELRGNSHVGCPKRLSVPAGGRAEALRLFEIFRDAKESSCLTLQNRTREVKLLECDAGFNVRSKVH